MEQFLADYGLKWIGNEGTKEGQFNSGAVNKELGYQAPAYRNNLPKEIDTDVLQRRIEELNFIAEKQRVVTNQYGMKEFKKLDPVHIFFFKNGIIIKGFKFSPYYAKEAQSILSDILDGYFPYDLKAKYPEGVPLEPVDLTDETYTDELLKDKSNPKFRLLSELNDKNFKPMSKKEFLDQFPKNVVSKGNLVPIREELEKRFQETGKIEVEKLNSNEPIEAPTPVVAGAYSESEVVTLRIRTETGKRTVLVKLLRSDKMQQVYDYVHPYVESAEKPYEIRSKFPNRAYARQESKTLEELGLAPSCALVIQN